MGRIGVVAAQQLFRHPGTGTTTPSPPPKVLYSGTKKTAAARVHSQV